MSNFKERFEISQWIWENVQFYCTMFWTFKGRDKVCKDCSHLLDIQIRILEEQQAGMRSKVIMLEINSKQFIGERAQLNGMGLKIPLFWVCLSEAYYTEIISICIYICCHLFWKCYMCGVAAGSEGCEVHHKCGKNPQFGFPTLATLLHKRLLKATSKGKLTFSSVNLWIWVMWCVFHLVRRILQLWFN